MYVANSSARETCHSQTMRPNSAMCCARQLAMHGAYDRWLHMERRFSFGQWESGTEGATACNLAPHARDAASGVRDGGMGMWRRA